MPKFLSAGLMAVATLGTVLAAQAQVCNTMCSRYEEGQCVEHTQTCTTPPPPEKFGAIAYGRTSGAWGYSYNWNSRAKAESAAMQNCGQRAKDCEVIVWYDRRCGAVAVDQGGGVYWGIGDGSGQANGIAQKQCAKGGGKGCAVKVSQCSR
jgi:hypothetical protein